MNIVFWGKEHQSGTTVHMLAVAGMLRTICGEERVITGRFLRNGQSEYAVSDCGVGLGGRRQHFLWNADIAVVNLKAKRRNISRFFDEDFHIAKNMMFLLGGCHKEDGVDASYLHRIYRIEPERVIVIPYNAAFAEAIGEGNSDAFIKREQAAPTTLLNEQFIGSVRQVAVRLINGFV